MFRDHILAGQPFTYVFLDTTYCNVRVNHRVVSRPDAVQLEQGRSAR